MRKIQSDRKQTDKMQTHKKGLVICRLINKVKYLSNLLELKNIIK